jgi:glycosyltransferase 2 family protein
VGLDTKALPPTSRRPGILRYLASGVLTLFFLWIAFRGTDMTRLGASMRDANYWWIAASLVLLAVSHVLRAWRWRYLLEPFKPGIPLRKLFSAVMIGYLFNNLLPRAGEFVRPYVIARMEPVPVSGAFGTIVMERIIDTFSFLFLFALLPLLYDGPLAESFPWLHDGGIIVFAGAVIGLGILLLLMKRRDWTDGLLRGGAKFLPRASAGKVEAAVHGFLDGFQFVGRPANFAVIFLFSVAIWGLYIGMMYVSFFAFGLAGRGFQTAVVILTISSIGTAIPTPGGTGSYHALTAQSLTRLYGVDPALALSFATVTHAAGYIAVTVAGIYFFLRDHINVADAFGRPQVPGA